MQAILWIVGLALCAQNTLAQTSMALTTEYRRTMTEGTVPKAKEDLAQCKIANARLGFSEAKDFEDLTEVVATPEIAPTIAVCAKTDNVFLLAAEFGPRAAAKDGKKTRGTVLPDSFHVLVVGK